MVGRRPRGGVLQISGTAAVIEGKRVEGTTIGGHARKVPLDPGPVEVLKAQRAAQDEERLAAGPDWPSGDYVFTRGIGLPLYPDTPSQLLSTSSPAASGHADPSMTLRVYAHIVKEAESYAAEVFAAAIRDAC